MFILKNTKTHRKYKDRNNYKVSEVSIFLSLGFEPAHVVSIHIFEPTESTKVSKIESSKLFIHSIALFIFLTHFHSTHSTHSSHSSEHFKNLIHVNVSAISWHFKGCFSAHISHISHIVHSIGHLFIHIIILGSLIAIIFHLPTIILFSFIFIAKYSMSLSNIFKFLRCIFLFSICFVSISIGMVFES